MIKINGEEYCSAGVDAKTSASIIGVIRKTDISVEKFLQTEDFTNTSVKVVQKIAKELGLRIPNRVLLLALLLLDSTPSDNDSVVFVCDLFEKFQRPPTVTRMIYSLYPNGFYTEDSLLKRIAWIKENKDSLKYPALVDYFY